MTTVYAGQRLTAALIEQFVPLSVVKGTDETVTSSSTVQADDELFIASIPPGEWVLRGELWVSGQSGSNQDVKFGWTFPTGTFTWSVYGYHANWSNVDGSRDANHEGDVLMTPSPSNARGFGTVTSANQPHLVSGRMSSTASGTLALTWAQNTSSVTGTTMKAGSWFELRKAVIT